MTRFGDVLTGGEAGWDVSVVSQTKQGEAVMQSVREIQIPLPGDEFDNGIVIASVWLSDDAPDLRATVLVLRPAAPWYVVEEAAWQDGVWTPTCRTAFPNIVPAVEEYQQSGGDY